MKIVALLQNMWVRDPERVRRMIERDTTGRLRNMIIERALFAGCLTGRRLRDVFGDQCDNIVWDECSPVIADNPRDYHAADTTHIESVIVKHAPDVVVCFSARGHKVARSVCERMGVRFVPSIHPAARGENTMTVLRMTKLLIEEGTVAADPNGPAKETLQTIQDAAVVAGAVSAAALRSIL